tara:strand:- start:698 stop:892 length:195 start_codon:yes stop_codon:yes gene_type:complete
MSKGSRDRTKDIDKFQENFDRIFKTDRPATISKKNINQSQENQHGTTRELDAPNQESCSDNGED